MTTTPAAPAQLDQLIGRITDLKAQIAAMSAELTTAQDQLTEALEAGDIDPSFSHDDWSFTYSQGRMTTTYSPEAKAAIKQLQEADISMGRATQKRGAGFWTIKPPAI